MLIDQNSEHDENSYKGLRITAGVILLFLFGFYLILGFLFGPAGIVNENRRMAHFERHQEKLEAVVREVIATDLGEVYHRAWWDNIFESPPREHQSLYEAIKRAKVRKVEVYQSDKGTKVNLITGKYPYKIKFNFLKVLCEQRCSVGAGLKPAPTTPKRSLLIRESR